jgi:hypothetical protein
LLVRLLRGVLWMSLVTLLLLLGGELLLLELELLLGEHHLLPSGEVSYARKIKIKYKKNIKKLKLKL